MWMLGVHHKGSCSTLGIYIYESFFSLHEASWLKTNSSQKKNPHKEDDFELYYNQHKNHQLLPTQFGGSEKKTCTTLVVLVFFCGFSVFVGRLEVFFFENWMIRIQLEKEVLNRFCSKLETNQPPSPEKNQNRDDDQTLLPFSKNKKRQISSALLRRVIRAFFFFFSAQVDDGQDDPDVASLPRARLP